jgi:hypothetical protein
MKGVSQIANKYGQIVCIPDSVGIMNSRLSNSDTIPFIVQDYRGLLLNWRIFVFFVDLAPRYRLNSWARGRNGNILPKEVRKGVKKLPQALC